eukprot:m.85410 g.85410  ORF g.85410 m.85410 type:complete len:240 (-) comp13010_c0_seq1:1180-1899(-)
MFRGKRGKLGKKKEVKQAEKQARQEAKVAKKALKRDRAKLKAKKGINTQDEPPQATVTDPTKMALQRKRTSPKEALSHESPSRSRAVSGLTWGDSESVVAPASDETQNTNVCNHKTEGTPSSGHSGEPSTPQAKISLPGQFDGDPALVSARRKLARGIISEEEFQHIVSTHNRGHLYESLALDSVANPLPTNKSHDPAMHIARRKFYNGDISQDEYDHLIETHQRGQCVSNPNLKLFKI